MAKRGTHNGRYILDGKIPVPCEDLLTWARWIEDHWQDRVVGRDQVGPREVSTVFLGLDHTWHDDIPPRLFETMVFLWKGDERTVEDDAPMWRTPTWEMALETHAEGIAWARERLD